MLFSEFGIGPLGRLELVSFVVKNNGYSVPARVWHVPIMKPINS